jgi:hypothetical protein
MLTDSTTMFSNFDLGETKRGERETERGTRRLGEVIETRDGERHADYASTPL